MHALVTEDVHAAVTDHRSSVSGVDLGRVPTQSAGEASEGPSVSSDLHYFTRRAADERSAASQARHPEAEQRHLEMAARYDELAGAIAATEQRLGIGSSDDPLRRN